MQIGVIGAGYVGLIQAVGLAHLGNQVILAERNRDKVAQIASGISPIFEPGLTELLESALADGSLRVTTSNVEAVGAADVVFLALPTPQGADGRADLSAVFEVVDEIAGSLGNDCLVATKSTVPVGTNAEIGERTGRTVASNPEFLQEGRGVRDFMNPDRIVIGVNDPRDAEPLTDLYVGIDAPMVLTDLASAELTKYAANGYLAARVTYANAIANVCEAVGADVADVLTGMGHDKRIGSTFLDPGPGFGGSCFPKDMRALTRIAADAGYDFSLMSAVIAANTEQLFRTVEKVRRAVGGDLMGQRVAVWGLAFKAGTDDVRESPAVGLINLMLKDGADVVAFDPQATVPTVEEASDPLAAADGAAVLLIATEWPQFHEVDLNELAARMKGRTIVDARNLLDPDAVRAVGLAYVGMGR